MTDFTEQSENNNKLKRSISNQEKGSDDNLLKYDEIKIKYLANIKKDMSDNVTNTHDSGYSSKKTMIVNGKPFTYTEDRNINFSFDDYHVIGATDGHGGSPKMSILVSGSFPIYFIDNFKKFLDIETALLKTFEEINQLAISKGGIGGTTLTVCVINKIINRAYIGNLGDSVTQIFRRTDDTFVSVFRTIDHDAENLNEQERLTSLFGNKVSFNYASGVMGGTKYAKIYNDEIMVVAGFGDFQFPDGFIRRNPDIYIVDLKVGDIIICSSDGFYETYKPDIKMLCAGRNEEEIITDLNELYDSKNLYNSLTLAFDLMNRHLEQTSKICGIPYAYELIKQNRDNNTITTFVIK